MLQIAPFLGGIATIIAALITVVGGSIAYRRQRNIDFQQELRKERRRIYGDFMSSLVSATQGDGNPHLRARLEIAQIGSERVIKALAAYNEYCDKTGFGRLPRDAEVVGKLLAAVLIEMRNEVFEKSTLTADEYAKLLPLS